MQIDRRLKQVVHVITVRLYKVKSVYQSVVRGILAIRELCVRGPIINLSML
jgi:hypothetical protein